MKCEEREKKKKTTYLESIALLFIFFEDVVVKHYFHACQQKNKGLTVCIYMYTHIDLTHNI